MPCHAADIDARGAAACMAWRPAWRHPGRHAPDDASTSRLNVHRAAVSTRTDIAARETTTFSDVASPTLAVACMRVLLYKPTHTMTGHTPEQALSNHQCGVDLLVYPAPVHRHEHTSSRGE